MTARRLRKPDARRTAAGGAPSAIARSSTALERSRSCTLLGDRVNPRESQAIYSEVLRWRPTTHAQIHLHERRASVAIRTILQVGALAGVAAGFMYAAWQMLVAAIAQDPTAAPGIHQTLWTPPEGIWSVVFGVHHFHGSFHFIPVFGGIVAHLANALVLGIVGIALLTALLGRRPSQSRQLCSGSLTASLSTRYSSSGSSTRRRFRRSTARRRTGAGGSATRSSV